jgi:hypothetical protein
VHSSLGRGDQYDRARALGHCRQGGRVPVYKLLGGKVRDEVRVYNGAIRREMSGSFAACSTFSRSRLGDLPHLERKARFLRTVLFG